MKLPVVRVVLGSGVAIAALAYFAQEVDASALLLAIETANRGLLWAVPVLCIASYMARSWRWGELLRPLVLARQLDLFSATMVGFAASLLVPRSGELLRPWLLARRCDVPVSSVFATVVIERLVDLLSVLALFALYVFVLPRPQIEVNSRWIDTLQAGGVVAGAVLVVSLALLWLMHAYMKNGHSWASRPLCRAPPWLAQRLAGLAKGFVGGTAVLGAPWTLWMRVAAQSALVWGLSAYCFHLVNLAFGIQLPLHCTLLLVTFVVVGESIPTPGLVGGFHVFYLVALTEVYGVDRQTAAAAAIAAHALTNLPVLLVGALLAMYGQFGSRAERRVVRMQGSSVL